MPSSSHSSRNSSTRIPSRICSLRGDYAAWRNYPLAKVEDSGQQEVLNWFLLAGAMKELGAKLAWSEFVETWIFNSNKVAAVYAPA